MVPLCSVRPDSGQSQECFLVEMVNVVGAELNPFVIGGDFNIMRRPEDKNKDNFNPR
jgi:endonuclease/exonuclease/phosphatase family metal-dependent hydrolase